MEEAAPEAVAPMFQMSMAASNILDIPVSATADIAVFAYRHVGGGGLALACGGGVGGRLPDGVGAPRAASSRCNVCSISIKSAS